MLIIVPSLVSGLGVAFIIAGIWLDQWVARNIMLTLGAILLWLDFFITMALFRHNSRDIDRRLQHLEEQLGQRSD